MTLLRNNDFFKLLIFACLPLFFAGVYNLRPGGTLVNESTIPIMVSIVTLFVEILILVIGAMVVVTNVKITTATLTEALKGLKQSVDGLREWMQRVDERVDGHAEDIAKLKTKSKINGH